MYETLDVSEIRDFLNRDLHQQRWPQPSSSFAAFEPEAVIAACNKMLRLLAEKEGQEQRERLNPSRQETYVRLLKEDREKAREELDQFLSEKGSGFMGRLRAFLGIPWTREKAERHLARVSPHRFPIPTDEQIQDRANSAFWELAAVRRSDLYGAQRSRVKELLQMAESPGVLVVYLTERDLRMLGLV